MRSALVSLPHILFTVAVLLVLIGLLQPLAARLNLSHTVLLAAVGVLIGVGGRLPAAHAA